MAAAPQPPAPSTGAESASSVRRSPVLGVIALGLASILVIALVFPPAVAPVFVALNLPRDDVTYMQVMVFGQGAAMLVPFALGTLAVITRRGRKFGIAAIAVSVVANAAVVVLLAAAIANIRFG